MRTSSPGSSATTCRWNWSLTATPFVLIAILFYFTVVVQNDVEKKEDNPAVVVDVTAFQWNWKFGYNQVTLANGESSTCSTARSNPDGSRRVPRAA